MYKLYKFHFLNGISEINQLFDDILIIWPAPVYTVPFLVKPVYHFEHAVLKTSMQYVVYTAQFFLERISIQF